MDNVNRTLYIPLYGKALVSKKGIILLDKKAEEIWSAAGVELKAKSVSKWLAYYMGMRSAVFDAWAAEQMRLMPGAAVLHIGCGLDSRNLRVGSLGHTWYDIDFPGVIEERKRFYQPTETYRMIGADARSEELFERIPEQGKAVVIMEGVSMYLQRAELAALLKRLSVHFSGVHILMDCYTQLAAKASKYKNPVNDVGVTQVFGIDEPLVLAEEAELAFVGEHDMTPLSMTEQLSPGEKTVFRLLYGGSIAKKMYRLYEFAGGGKR